jgi:hypothetical protein
MPSPWSRSILALWAGVAIAAFLWAGWPAVGAPFLADDFILLEWSQPRTIEQVLSYFATDWGGEVNRGGYYRPLVNLTFGLDWWLHGNEPWGHHVTNLAMHLAATLVLFALARRFLSALGALVTASLFLVHPLHDLSVLWLSGRTDLLCAIFFFASLALALSPSSLARWLAVPAFALALLAKEMAVTVPLILGLHAFARSREGRWIERAFDAARAMGPFLVVLVATLALRVAILGGLGGDARLFAVGTNTAVGASRLFLWSVVPWDLGPLEGPLTTPWVIGLVFLAGAALAWTNRQTLFAVPGASFACGLLVLSLLPVLGQPASWYVYIPSAGACLLLASFLTYRTSARATALVAAGIVIAFTVSLRHNATKIAQAGAIVDGVLHDVEKRGVPVLLVNAPICYAGRLPLLTSKTQYDSAFRLRGTGAQARPLTYAYVGNTADFVSIATTSPGVVEAAVFGDPDTFLVMGDTGRLPPGPAEGASVQGRDARYTVRAVGEDGKVIAMRLSGVSCAGATAILEYYPGGLRPLASPCKPCACGPSP